MKLRDVLAVQETLDVMSSMKMPFKIAYEVAKLQQKLEPTFTFYRNTLTEIIKEFAEKEEDGTPKFVNDGRGISVSEENRDACDQKIAELYDVDVDVSPMKVTVEDLEKVEGLELTGIQMYALMSFLSE